MRMDDLLYNARIEITESVTRSPDVHHYHVKWDTSEDAAVIEQFTAAYNAALAAHRQWCLAERDTEGFDVDNKSFGDFAESIAFTLHATVCGEARKFQVSWAANVVAAAVNTEAGIIGRQMAHRAGTDAYGNEKAYGPPRCDWMGKDYSYE